MNAFKRLFISKESKREKCLKEKIVEFFQPFLVNKIKITQFQFHKVTTGLYFRGAVEKVDNKYVIRFQIRKREIVLIKTNVEPGECIICFEKSKTLTTCCRKHLCSSCYKKLTDERCPHCRKFFQYMIENFQYEGGQIIELGIIV